MSKELSIKEKAKAYDEAIKLIKKCATDKYGCVIGIKPSDIFSELKESEDERIKGAIIDHLKDNNLIEWATWLEKQVVQKSTDKIKPKFHEGEWITNGDYTWQIVMVKSLDYILQSQGGNIVEDTISHVDEQFHSFTIKDAKDGDVLRIKNLTFIFQEIIYNNDCHNNVVVAHCSYEDNDEAFGIDGPDCITDLELITPATKQQCDLLFWKMKEAGYEWGVKKK